MDTEMRWNRVKESMSRGTTKYRLPIFLTVAIVLLLAIIFAIFRSSASPVEINPQDNLNPEVIEDDNVVDDYNQTYAIRYVIKRSKKLPVTNFTCMVQNTQDPCPVYMEVFKEVFQAELVHLINQYISVHGLVQLTFENDTVTFKAREKLHYFSFGGFRVLNETDESVFGSIDYNWDRKIEFNPKEIITATVRDSKSLCTKSIFNESGILFSCRRIEPTAIQFTNWIRTVFGLEALNATWTIGMALNYPRITSELSLIGRIQEGWSRQDVQRNIILFDNQQKEWCKCMKPLSERFIQEADNRWTCFQNLATRKEFQMQFDYKICEREARHEEEGTYITWL